MKVDGLHNKAKISSRTVGNSSPAIKFSLANRKKLAALKARILAPKVRSRIAAAPAKFALAKFTPAVPSWPFSKTASITLALGLLCAFVAGAWVTWQTSFFAAATSAAPAITTPQNPDAGRETLFNTPLNLLKDYVSNITPTVDTLEQRREKLKLFLQEHNSPLVQESDVIAQQSHWKLILAISFAESTLGRSCYYNNCSGIGGSQIKTYASLSQWIVDFNDLLERRYKDKTLEQMCGIYVQPCNPNWLSATGQILNELQADGIY